MMDLLISWQRWIYGDVRASLLEFSQSGDFWLLVSMIGTGVLFGAIHALTPGHGKTILASYVAGARSSFARAFSVSTLLAATHVLTAVLIAFFASQLVERSFVGGGRAPALELISRLTLIGIGAWLFVRAIRSRPGRKRAEGFWVALTAGLVPCPLTLFVVVAALSQGEPGAGLMFAASMLVGIAFTLCAVAGLAVFGQRLFLDVALRNGATLSVVSRALDATSGILIILFAGIQLLE
ncbi:HoxN/HupN/NixA family nickel/cobalt transporter [Roseibium sp. RP-7]